MSRVEMLQIGAAPPLVVTTSAVCVRLDDFAAPVGSWLKGPLREQVHDLLDPQRVRDRGIFAPEFVDWLLREFYGGSKDLTIQLYQVFLLERWMELFVDGAREVPA